MPAWWLPPAWRCGVTEALFVLAVIAVVAVFVVIDARKEQVRP